MTKSSKILSFFFLIFCITLYFTQEINAVIRVQYNFTSKPFKNKVDSITENFVSIIGKDKSIFKPVNRYIYDSLNIEGKQKEAQSHFDIGSQVNILVSSDEINYSNLIGTSFLGYKENNNFNWKVLNEFKDIKGLKCQKAITKKFGRNWIAYFSKDYLFPFGPYKFNGLPGLIIEIYDENKNFQYVLSSIKKYPKKYNFITDNKIIFIKKSDYIESRRNIILDPTFGGKLKFDENTTRDIMRESEVKLKNENLIEREEN